LPPKWFAPEIVLRRVHPQHDPEKGLHGRDPGMMRK
jgi:hypothetical protein